MTENQVCTNPGGVAPLESCNHARSQTNTLYTLIEKLQTIDWTYFYMTVPLEKLLAHVKNIRKTETEDFIRTDKEAYFSLVFSALLSELIPEQVYNVKILHLAIPQG